MPLSHSSVRSYAASWPSAGASPKWRALPVSVTTLRPKRSPLKCWSVANWRAAVYGKEAAGFTVGMTPRCRVAWKR